MTKFTGNNLRMLRGLLLHSRFYSSSSNCKKICIVGSGPAGFYTAQQILRKSDCEVDIYEKLPVPFGLIRYGVAPDHPEIKIVTNSFTKIAKHEKCRFFGNVNVGYDITLSELLLAYNAVVLAYGASKDNELGIPGEDCPNVFSARKFVSWYNGHPKHVNDKYDLDNEVAVIVGHGNVALDAARILLRNTDELKVTDIAQHAMECLLKSKVKKVVLIGRRGPTQVSFTIKELREMLRLKDCSPVMSLNDFAGIPEIIPDLPRSKKRLVELLYNTAVDSENKASDKKFEIKFFRSPKQIICEDGKTKKIVLQVNTVEDSTEQAQVISTKEREELDCGLVLRSVGYKSMSIDSELPFNYRKFIVPNEGGRVTAREEWPPTQTWKTTNSLYCSGWVKSGPVGVILSTMNGGYETAEKILEDIPKQRHFSLHKSGRDMILGDLVKRGIRYTTFDDWLKINEVELERGKAAGKFREKICNVEEMLKIAGV